MPAVSLMNSQLLQNAQALPGNEHFILILYKLHSLPIALIKFHGVCLIKNKALLVILGALKSLTPTYLAVLLKQNFTSGYP